MKFKKLLSLLICFIMVISCFSFSASANGMIEYDIYVNNERYSYKEILTKIGDTISISIENVLLDDASVDESEISYEWSKFNSQTQTYDIIDGANSSSFSEIYDGCTKYSCFITIGNNNTSRKIYFKEDTLTLSAISNCNINYEDTSYIITPGLVGAKGTITVSAESTIDNANITYEWDKQSPYFQYPTDFPTSEPLNNTTNSIDFELTAGGLSYGCTVSDGTTIKSLDFIIFPDETLTMTNLANGKVPSMYAGTYIYVVKPNEKVTLDVTSSSTFGDVTYTWFKPNPDHYFPYDKLDETKSVLEIIKSEPTQDDPYATQPFECFIEDGNQLIRYQMLLFCIDPETQFSEINKLNQDTPDINFVTDNENLANNVLSGNDLFNMAYSTPTNIELSAELKNTVNETDKTEINSKLQDNQKIGMYLEMNLQKDIDGQEIPVTDLNSSIELSVKVPENLINNDDNIKRDYQVIRIHNGEAEVLDCEFEQDTNILSFKTDKFSLYTITYTDKTPNAPETTEKPEISPDTSENSEDAQIPTSPQTEDTSNYQLWIALSLISALGILNLYSKKENLKQ